MQEYITAFLILFIIGVVGICVNGVCVYKIRKITEMQNVFGYICFSHCISNIGVLTIFVCFGSPMILFQNKSDFIYLINTKFGQLGMFFWYISMYSHVFICVNRFLAIYFPLKYNKIFTFRNSCYYVGSIWVIATIHILPYFGRYCDYYFDAEAYLWTFSLSECSHILGGIIDFYISLVYVSFTIVTDLLIFAKLWHRTRNNKNTLELKTQQQTTAADGRKTNLGTKTFYRRTIVNFKSQVGPKKERPQTQNKHRIKFFLQAFCQNLLFLAEINSFYLISVYFTEPLSIMAFTSVAWELCHALDGVILMLFNAEIRKIFTNCGSKK
uniref:G_PROTEIN_RECEP_F1_2 domain-containing protein n=1 Tax=Rhabditophanes sp. KR3021 TaxID=114890 RepID=A0AC35TUC7_9BILA